MSVSYILDPDDPNLQKQIDHVDNQLSKEKGYMTTTNLDRGIVEHKIITQHREKVTEIVNSVNYVPVTVTLNKNIIPNDILLDNLMLGVYLEGVKEILTLIAEKSLKVDVSSIEMLDLKDAYVFNLGVFENDEYLSYFIQESNPDKYLGYTLFNKNPMVRYVLEKWYQNGDYVPKDINVKYLNINGEDIAIIPIGNDTYGQDRCNNIKDKMDMSINNLLKTGHFSYSFGIHNLQDLEYIKELCYMWNIEIVYQTDLSLLVLRTDVDFSITPREWLGEALQKIKVGGFPHFNLTGEWQFSYHDDYIRHYGSLYRDVILYYATYLSYADLSDLPENNLIKTYINSIYINEDLSISVELPTYELVDRLKNRIIKTLKEGILGIENKSCGIWLIEPCENLQVGINKRWLVQNVDHSAYPMIFKDKNGRENLIYRSKLAIKYPSPFDFSKDNMEKSKTSLKEELITYYSKKQICHDNLEPVLLENISEMELEDLLKIIPSDTEVTYCFSADTLSKLDKLENPLTRQPFSEKVINRWEMLEWGWRGLFDVGPLYGLYQEVPTRVLIPTTVGLTDMVRVKTLGKERELKGNLFLIDVVFEDRTSTPLFEISLPTVGLSVIDQVRDYIDILWQRGYFLSDWNSAIQNYMDTEFKSYSVTTTNPILLGAGDSIFDGNKAVKLLRNMYNQ